ncbi:MAG: phosphoglycerate kinase [Chloroflexi bacterium]|nr:phosphoglycerate kinase [Chloroflexota bacterium]
MNKRHLIDFDVVNQRVLVRVDFNVPLNNSGVADDSRIRAALPTIRMLIENQAAIILCSHLGRPNGKRVSELSLKPIAAHLSKLLNRAVGFVSDCVGPQAERRVQELQPGEILLLENTRFHIGEKENHPDFAKQLASLADLFVNDAFGAAHRAHASTVGVTKFLPSAAGLLMEKELSILGSVFDPKERPLVAILGGAKIADKIGLMKKFLQVADALLLGGGMANTFLVAQGHSLGDSLVDFNSVEVAGRYLDEYGEKLLLPRDAVIADSISAEAQIQTVSVDEVPEGWRILDIGPQTRQAYSKSIEEASLIVWNGPMGVFEIAAFSEGTNAIAREIAQSEARAIIGGGDSAAAIKQLGLQSQIYHLSTGGGATLAYLSGAELPGVAALDDRPSEHD